MPLVRRESLDDGWLQQAVSGIDRLSPRQAEVLRLVAIGKSNQEIRDMLAMGRSTFRGHLWLTYRTLGLGGLPPSSQRVKACIAYWSRQR